MSSPRPNEQFISPTKKLLGGLIPFVLFSVALGLFIVRDQWLTIHVGDMPQQIDALRDINRLLLASIWLFGCWSVLNLVDILIWQRIARRRQRATPRLLRSVFAFITVGITAVLAGLTVFEIAPLTIGIVLAILTLIALLFFKDFLAEVFAGLSIHLDDHFKLGDRIRLDDNTVGTIGQISWRSTELKSDSGTIVVPNTVLSRTVIRNETDLGQRKVVRMHVQIDASVSVDRVIRVLGAALTTLQKRGYVCLQPAAEVGPLDTDRRAVNYEITFYVDVDVISEAAARALVLNEVFSHLQASGLVLAVAGASYDIAEHERYNRSWLNLDDRVTLLTNIEIFEVLEPDELLHLAEATTMHVVEAGRQIIVEGETTVSMYGLVEGLLQVSVRQNDNSIHITWMTPLDFFGEMAMLAGEPRSATVTAVTEALIFEISRDNFYDLLAKRPALAEAISPLIAARQLATMEKLSNASRVERDAALQTATDNLFSRIKHVFVSLFADETNSK